MSTGEFRIREFRPEDATPLTVMLHRAYGELGAAGLNFTAVDQDESTTLRRAGGGASWVAVDGASIVAAMTISVPAEAKLCDLTAFAAAPGRAWLNQLAVDPDQRGRGLARRLRDVGYEWCRAGRLTSIGLDTASPAHHLRALYRGWGFDEVDTVQWPGKTYESVVMVRDLVPAV